MSKSTLTRRALVASTAAVPAAAALSLPAVAQATAEPDPIFAAIEVYREAWDRLGKRGPQSGEEEEEQLCFDMADAARNLCRTAPTTIAGLAAVLTFITTREDDADNVLSTFASDDERDFGSPTILTPFLRTLTEAAEQLARLP